MHPVDSGRCPLCRIGGCRQSEILDQERRWHDNRHSLITDLAESGAADETIRDIAGHVSKQMLKHYSHIRMEAKRRALEAIVQIKPLLMIRVCPYSYGVDLASEAKASFISGGVIGASR